MIERLYFIFRWALDPPRSGIPTPKWISTRWPTSCRRAWRGRNGAGLLLRGPFVSAQPAARWPALADEVRRLRRPEDEFVYEPVFVGSFEDAFCAAAVNPALTSVVVPEGFRSLALRGARAEGDAGHAWRGGGSRHLGVASRRDTVGQYRRGRPAGFTAIGPAVNLVSRLEGLCRPLGRSVLISGAVAAETTASLVPLGEHVLRGIAAPCTIFTLPDAEPGASIAL